MPAQTDVEMQYQAPSQMAPAAPSENSSAAEEVSLNLRGRNFSADLVQTCVKEQPKRTFLGMRGGGIIRTSTPAFSRSCTTTDHL